MLSMIWIAHMTPASSRPADLLDRPVPVDPPAAEPLKGDQIQTADCHADHGQERVAGEHHGHVDDQGQAG